MVKRVVPTCPPEVRSGERSGRLPGRRLPFYVGGALIAAAAWTRYRDARRWRAGERELRRLRNREMAAGRFAHDFNNLLTTIRGNADCADTDLPRESPARRYLDDIRLAVDTASQLCDDLLCREDPGENRREFGPVSIDALLRELLQVLESTTLKHARVETDIAPDLPCVPADAGTLRQVLLNLLVNAAEALPGTDGTIRVHASVQTCNAADLTSRFLPAGHSPEAGDFAVIEISDSGCGMPPETLEKIFEPYFTTKKTGTGLGLAALPDFIRSHSGSIRIESRPGQGTQIRLYLPLA